MDYYKVLLVDDEEDARQSIVRKLDWASLGFEVAGEADNGEEALELAERLQPDVIMTDIKMPFMDGLELCRRVKRLLPGVRVAIFSGFDEFDYAREAITQQVEEYILKPIDAGMLADVFRRLRKALDAEIAERRNVERLRRHYNASLPLMRQQFLSGVLDGRMEPGIAGRPDEYGLDLAAEEYCVAVIRYEADGEGADDTQLLAVSLRQLLEDMRNRPLRFYIVQTPGRFVLLFLLQSGGTKQVPVLLNQLFPISKRLLNIRLSIGVGGGRTRLDEVPLSYQEARNALEYQLLVEPGQCIYLGDIEPGAIGNELPDAGYAEEILRQIKIGGKPELAEAVRRLTRHLKAISTGVQQYRIYMLELFTELLKLIRTYRMDPAEARQESLLLEGMDLRFSNLDELGEWLLGYCENLRLLARRERKDSVRLLIDRAKELLAERYADSELSLDTLCARLNVSPAYFSTLFKKETGQGFVSYLTALRMEKALELLASTDDKTYQIAEKIGYADPNYFSYVFKKQFGASPSKYKAERGSRDGPSPDPAG